MAIENMAARKLAIMYYVDVIIALLSVSVSVKINEDLGLTWVLLQGFSDYNNY